MSVINTKVYQTRKYATTPNEIVYKGDVTWFESQLQETYIAMLVKFISWLCEGWPVIP